MARLATRNCTHAQPHAPTYTRERLPFRWRRPHQSPPPPRFRQVTSAPPIPNPNNPVRSAPPRSVAAATFTRAAAPTVQKLVPAQHNPALKALVPASVRIQRQKEVVPPSKRQRVLNAAPAKQPAPEEKSGKAAEDDQYLGFLDEVAHLGAFEG